MQTRSTLATFVAVAAFFFSCSGGDDGSPSQRLRVLAYVGYDESPFIEPISDAINANVIVETYVGGEEMYTKFTESPRGTYDVVVLDAEYGQRLFREERIVALDEDLWQYPDLFAPFKSGQPAKTGDAVFAATARWGALGLVFNTEKIDAARVNDYSLLYQPDIRGRIGLYDWYLPNMGVISLSQGNREPYNLSKPELEALAETLMKLRPQVTSIQPSPGQVLAALRSGDVWLAPAIGEWAAAALAAEGHPIDWVVPSPGGIMWVEAFAIAADSENPALARSFVREAMTPEVLARLATRRAYYSQVTRKSAYRYIPPDARKHLKAQELGHLEALAERLQFRHLPGPTTTERDWIRVWGQFKAGG